MLDLANSAAVSGTQLLDHFKVLWPQIEVELYADFQLRRIVIASVTSQVGILGSRRRLGRCWGESKALDILPLHRAGCKAVCHGCVGVGLVEGGSVRRTWAIQVRLQDSRATTGFALVSLNRSEYRASSSVADSETKPVTSGFT